MIKILDHLTGINPGIGRNLFQAIATLLKRDKLEALSKRLNDYRQEVGLHIVSLLNAKVEKEAVENARRFKSLEESHRTLQEGQKKIVEIITFTQTLVKAASPLDLSENERQILQNQITDVEKNEGKTSITPEERNENTVSAILILDDGTSQIIARPLHLSTKGENSGNSTIETATSFNGNRDPTMQQIVSVSRFASLSRTILDLLYYEAISYRIGEIRDAHRHTFQWIFSESTSTFPKWLTSGEGCWWVNGKAGSGKSTLMKFILVDPRTRMGLQTWAKDNTLVVVSFFFWHAGSSIQKLEILQQQQHLIPLVFPDLCRAYFTKGSIDAGKMTLPELHKALRILLDPKTSSLKVCLLIDGLDEYAGDHEELCNLLLALVASPNVKAVISSRPWNVFEHMFGDYPHIRMQDLTQKDIEAYVKDMFSASKAAEKLEKLDLRSIDVFVAEITSAASGVFLWVMLVVRSLLNGLTNADSVEILRRRLEALPTDLEELYTHMINSMEPIYRQQASLIFQVVIRSKTMQVYGPMSLLQLFYAAEGSLTKAIRAPRKLLPASDRANICSMMDTRLKTQCCGLIEVTRNTAEIFSGSTSIEANVEFIHKTAVDFLRLDKIWEQLLSYVPQESFDADASLLASCLQEAKALPKERAIILESDRVMIDMRHCFTYSRYLETAQNRPYTAVLNQLDLVLTDWWANAEKCKARASSLNWKDTVGMSWSEWVAVELYPNLFSNLGVPPFLALATYSGCVLYVADKTLGNSAVSNDERTALLVQMIAQFFSNYSDDYEWYSTAFEDKFNYVTAIRLLLDQGADPNSITIPQQLVKRAPGRDTAGNPACVYTPWTYFLSNVTNICIAEKHEEEETETRDPYQTITRATEILEIFQSFIERNANIDVSIPPEPQMNKTRTAPNSASAKTVTMILDRLSSVVCDPAERIFRVPLQEIGLVSFRAKYDHTLGMIGERKGTRRFLTLVKNLFKHLTAIQIPQESKSLLSFIVGIAIALVVARMS